MLAVLAIFVALIMPNAGSRILLAGTYVRLPIEGFLAIGLVLLLPGRWKRITAGILGAGLAVITIEKVADIGFRKTLARPFDPVLDWVLLDDAQSFLKDSVGQVGAVGALGVILAILAILAGMSWAAVRVTRLAERHRRATFGTALTGTAVWVVLLMVGVQVFGTIPVAARSTAMYVWDRAHTVKAGLRDEKAFEKLALTDKFAGTPGDQLLTGLRGKDVMIFFVESYGRSAIEDPTLNKGADGGAGRRHRDLEEGRLCHQERLARLAHGGRRQLAGALDAAVRAVDRQAEPLPEPHVERPADPRPAPSSRPASTP